MLVMLKDKNFKIMSSLLAMFGDVSVGILVGILVTSMIVWLH